MMFFQQYYLGLPLARALPDRRHRRPVAPSWSTRSATSPSTSPTPTRHGLRIDARARDALPRRLPLRPPRAGRAAPAPRSSTARPRPAAPSSRSETLGDGERISLGDGGARDPRDAGPHAGVDLRSWSGSTARRHVPYGVLTGDTLFIGDVGRPDLLAAGRPHRRGAGPAALPLAARQAAHPARRDPGLPGPRRRLGVRQEPVHRDRLAPSANSAAPTTRSPPMTEDDFVEAVTEGQSVAPLYFLVRRHQEPPGARAAGRRPSRRRR